MRVESIGSATLYCGDARELLAGLAFQVVVTDPPWDQARDIPGAEDPRGLFAAVSPAIARARCAAIQLGSYSDPCFLAPLAAQMPFFRVCWMRYVPSHYKGRVLNEADVAYIFGTPPRSSPGRRVLPAQCVVTNREPIELEFVRGTGRNRSAIATAERMKELRHPMPRSVKHMRWLAHWYSEPGDVVADPFMGSGTTGIACVALGLPFRGIEIEPRFFDLACERIAQAQAQSRLFA